MRRIDQAVSFIAFWLLVVSPATAHTWYVGGPNADFDQIQPAIDASSKGDLIFVSPGETTYEGFTLTKGVTIRSTSGRFKAQYAIVTQVPVYETAAISDFEMDYFSFLRITDCEGTVLLENGLVIWYSQIFDCVPVVQIDTCPFVFMTDVQIEGHYYQYCDPAPTLWIQNAWVLLSDVRVYGPEGEPGWDPWGKAGQGGDGVGVYEFANVTIARAQIEGGKGGKGAPGDLIGNTGEGGDGGAGLVVEPASHVMALGCCGDFIKGGDGGDGGDDFEKNQGKGGDGGPGLIGSGVVISGTSLLGGDGGLGQPNGQDGPPYKGDPVFVDPPYPVLDMQGDLHPGSQFTITLHGPPDQPAVLLLSNSPAWVDPPQGSGPPFVALPGGWFLAFPVGRINPQGMLTVSLEMPDDPSVQGFALTSQAAILPGGKPFVLSNAAVRVVGE